MVKRLDEGFSNSMETKLEDFAQEYGGIDYNDIGKLSKCWDSLDADTKKNIQKLVSTVRKACKEAGMDAGELANEYPEDKKNCDALVKAVKAAGKMCSKKESLSHRRLTEKKWTTRLPQDLAKALRDAIDEEDYDLTAAMLKQCWEAIHNMLPDEYDEYDLEQDCERIDEVIDQLNDDEDYEYEEAEDDLNWLLKEFYDFCDSMSIWIGGLK